MVTSVRHFQSDKYSHANGVDSCLTHAVEAVYPPLEFWISSRVGDIYYNICYSFPQSK